MWNNTENGTYKQSDYTLISNKQRNWATQTKTNGTSNINGSYQHQLIPMKYESD